MEGIIFDIQRFSIYDGPGIRTNVFFKGCNLRCLWCHNPESQLAEKQLLFYSDKCVGCGNCAAVCDKTFTPECAACGRCVSVCPHGARKISGETITAQDAADKVSRDIEFYRTSGGGVTLSGGEPLLQPDFAREILRLCRERGINTAIETAGCVPWDNFEKVIEFTDLFLFDIKAVNNDVHRRCTGVSNERILENAEKLKKTGAEILFRTPVVPGHNDGELTQIAEFVKPFRWELLAYHATGSGKYTALDMQYTLSGVVPPTKEYMDGIARKFGAEYNFTGV